MDSITQQSLAHDLIGRLRLTTFSIALISFFIAHSFINVSLKIFQSEHDHYKLPIYISTYNQLLTEFKQQGTRPTGLMEDALRDCILIDTTLLTVHLAYDLATNCSNIWEKTIIRFYADDYDQDKNLIFEEFSQISDRYSKRELGRLSPELLLRVKSIDDKIISTTKDNPWLISKIVKFHSAVFQLQRDLGNISRGTFDNWNASAEISLSTLISNNENSSNIFGFSFTWGSKSILPAYLVLLLFELSLLSFISQIYTLNINVIYISPFLLFHTTKTSLILRFLFYCALILTKLICIFLVMIWLKSFITFHEEKWLNYILYVSIITVFIASIVPTYLILKKTKIVINNIKQTLKKH